MGTLESIYRKAVYRECTDATFKHLESRPARQRYLGLVGPLIRAEVGDTVKIVFRITERIRRASIPTASRIRLRMKARCRVAACRCRAPTAIRSLPARRLPTFGKFPSAPDRDRIGRFIGKADPKKLYATTPLDSSSDFDLFMGSGMPTANFKSNMNGYHYADMPMPVMHGGENVRRYVLTIGEGLNFHTPHWHGNSIVSNGDRVDVLNIAPAQSLIADMIPDNPGIRLYHCRVSDHKEAGMVARCRVLP